MRIYSHIIIDISPFYITVITILNTDSRIKDVPFIILKFFPVLVVDIF